MRGLRFCWGIAFLLGGHYSMSLANESGVAPAEVEEYLAGQGKTVLTFVGYSGAGYEDPAAMIRQAREILAEHSPDDTIVNIGATEDGIGAIYKVARRMGFETFGIVSIQARKEGVETSENAEVVFFVADDTWGGMLDDGKTLSPTSETMVHCSDLMVGIGGGEVARDELLEAKRRGKKVRYFPADMNHKKAIKQAEEKGEPAPTDFKGAAFAEFGSGDGDDSASSSR